MTFDARHSNSGARQSSPPQPQAPTARNVRPDTMWLVALHAAACRRWLASDPPNLSQARSSLARMERIGQCRASLPSGTLRTT